MGEQRLALVALDGALAQVLLVNGTVDGDDKPGLSATSFTTLDV